MNDRIKLKNWERWYPLTYPGYYKEDLTKSASMHYECCRLDVTLLRGETIGLSAISEEENAFSTLVDTKGKVLEQWKTTPETIHIPPHAQYLYLSNNYVKNPDFYVLVPSDKHKKANGLLFYEDFTGDAVLDGNDFFDMPLDECRTSQGLLLPYGIENALVIHKSTAMDGWSLTADVTVFEGTETICLGTRITQNLLCPHATLCCVDLSADELRLFRNGNGREMPEQIVKRISLSGLIDKGEFTLRLERMNTAICASVINPVTGSQVSITQELNPEETDTMVAGGCLAGKMYDSAQIFALSGAPILRRFYAAAKVSPKVMFFGDSITQGAHNLPQNSWAQMCAAEIGNSICCGRGSGDIWSCLNQVRSLLPTLRPKAMVVTIGTNNQKDIVSTETVKYLYEKIIRMAEYQGVILILNCITVCGREHIAATNQILRALPTLKSRFDLALVENHQEDGKQIPSYYAADQIHLNGDGNRELYKRFMQDFSWLRNL